MPLLNINIDLSTREARELAAAQREANAENEMKARCWTDVNKGAPLTEYALSSLGRAGNHISS